MSLDVRHEAPRRRSGYVPPASESVRVASLKELLPAKRVLPEGQQRRLEIAGEFERLWCVGNTALLARPVVAIIGTRSPSSAGEARARRLARELTANGVVVASGLARGIDTEALTEAIQGGGSVIAVIGTPIDRAYPAENAALQQAIYERHLLVSQFAPGPRTYPSNFPERNKVMAALSDASVIIEASDTSGTLHQAAECVRLGRWLFVAASVLEDPRVSWPERFRSYEKMRPLKDTRDLVAVVSA